MGQELGPEEHYDNLGISSAGEEIISVIGAVEASDLIQLSLDALWLVHNMMRRKRLRKKLL